MRNQLVRYSAFLCILQTSIAQPGPPTYQWISTGTVEARVERFGPLLTEYRIPGPTGTYTVPAFKDIELWIGGTDPAGNLCLSMQKSEPNLSRFQGGFRNIFNSAGVWKVTKAQIQQHKLDFEEDGDIDFPLPSIYSWPGKGNPFSITFNGFQPSDSSGIAAPFEDLANDGIYDPSKGDFPLTTSFGFDSKPPDETIYTPFFERLDIIPSQYNAHSIYLDGSALYFSYFCDENDGLDDVIFGRLNLQQMGTERHDSMLICFKLNGDVGYVGDDYMGVLTAFSDTNQVYFYNADDNDPIFGVNPPLVGFEIYQGPIDNDGNETSINSLMPLYFSYSPVPVQMKPPSAPAEFYNYMTGSWRDGTPLTEGGNGLNLGNPNAVRILIPYPGNPDSPDEWSEKSISAPVENRAVLLSTGPVSIKPGHVKSVIFALEQVPGGASITNQLNTLHDYSSTHFLLFKHDFLDLIEINPIDTLSCFATSGTTNKDNRMSVQISPNPSLGSFTVNIENQEITSVSLFNVLGRSVSFYSQPDTFGLSIESQNLPPGLYWLSGICKNGQPFQGKLIITR